MDRNIFDTLDEAIEDAEGGKYFGQEGIVLLPPANDPYASDEEEDDDDIGLAGNINLPSHVTEAVKIHRMMSKVITMKVAMMVMGSQNGR